jgi:3-phenylpropionate/trans-cinnamate dioxygenase ferredoxin subunit
MSEELVCALDDLVVDHAKRVVVGQIPVALVLDSTGTVHAIGDTCTHGDISLAEGFVEDGTLECWAHGSQFELTSGKPLSLPAFEPVPVFTVSLRDGNVFIDPTTPKVI